GSRAVDTAPGLRCCAWRGWALAVAVGSAVKAVAVGAATTAVCTAGTLTALVAHQSTGDEGRRSSLVPAMPLAHRHYAIKRRLLASTWSILLSGWTTRRQCLISFPVLLRAL